MIVTAKEWMCLLKTKERVTGFEPVNNSLGSYRLTTWPHPRLHLPRLTCPYYIPQRLKIKVLPDQHGLTSASRQFDTQPKCALLFISHLFAGWLIYAKLGRILPIPSNATNCRGAIRGSNFIRRIEP